ncbi:MAG TPA: family 10 glycosylhydrolase [Candidatus Alistipes faecigallinarum]|nr:family 10 glycosylhydrolase [Candidatus Alistipes faecigallinarum]
MKTKIKWLALAAAALTLNLGAASCSSESKTPEWEWDDPEPEPEPVPASEKPRFIWVDAAANFPDFANSKENIARDLAKAKEAGFTDIVVDVRPTTGDVLFRSKVGDPVQWLGAWLPQGYSKVERTATWDYLQAFIDEGRKLGLRIHAAFNTFPGGNATSIGNEGVVFRDAEKAKWATQLNLAGGITSILDAPDYSAKFFNPVLPEVQEYLCSMLEELAAYDGLEGIFLDRGRFDGFTSDFSDYTRREFEKYIGATVVNFPADILPAGHKSGLPATQPPYMKKWMEFRVKVIHDFMAKAREAVKKVNPDLKFGVYVGGWYADYYDVGVNWASPRYDTGAKYAWATADYKNYGYADLMDQMLIGAYAAPNRIYGSTDWTMEGFCSLAMERTMGDCPMVAGGPDVGNWDDEDKFTQEEENQAVKNSVAACINACDGYFLFDMIHLKKADQWSYAKAGIDAAISEEK